jgi:glycosyltransferase involved in cell wall biosynthesis
MKIAVLSTVAWRTPPRHYGPWELVASNLTEGLVKAGMDVTLFATADSLTKAKLDAVIEKGYEEEYDQSAKVVECLHISNLMEKASEYDVIHNHFDFLPLTYSRLISTPMITTIHGFSSQNIIPVYKKYNSGNHYVSISYADRSTELNYIANVYHGIDTTQFSFNDKPENYLLYFGRIHPDKGTAEAIEIAKRSKRRLLIAGIIQDNNYFKEKIESCLNEDIVFLGSADAEKRNTLLSNASALLHPINFEEPFGLSVAEAMLCGTPVIAFNKGSMPELIEDKKTGFLVSDISEAIDAVSMIEKIDRHTCHRHSKEKFSIERMVKAYIDVYEKILYNR